MWCYAGLSGPASFGVFIADWSLCSVERSIEQRSVSTRKTSVRGHLVNDG